MADGSVTHGSLFSGIGGFDLAAEWMGWENLFHCEWNEFGQRVLNHYWPDAESFNDITQTDFTKYANKIDILTGGFPCQPYSQAGKRLGKEDDRHLWPEMLRAIREISPTFVVGENVSGLINWDGGVVFEEVQADLEAEGYEVQAVLLPACAINAPHRRDRVWFVAYSNSESRKQGIGRKQRIKGQKREQIRSNTSSIIEKKTSTNANKARTNERLQYNGNGAEENEGREEQSQPKLREISRDGYVADTNFKRLQRRIQVSRKAKQTVQKKKFSFGGINGGEKAWNNFPTQPPVCSGNDGIPSKLDGITFPKWRNESIKAYGNSIVPQLALKIFKAIENCDIHHSITNQREL